MKFAKRIAKLQPSGTLNAAAKARDLKSKGIDIIDFTLGQPSFPTPEKVKLACKEALDEGLTGYGPVPGLPELREAIAAKLKEENNLDYSADEIIVNCGAKHSIFLALQVLIDEGDEVLIPKPYWVSYPSQVEIAGGQPKFLETTLATDLKIRADQLKEAINPKTKMLILNSPSNPTGMAYSTEELKAIGDICLEKNIIVLSDEIYDQITYDGFIQTSFLKANPKMKELTLTINGASKSYSMTGWRVGFVAGPKEFIDKIKMLQSQEITSIPTFIQKASVTAFSKIKKELAQFVALFTEQRQAMMEIAEQISHLKYLKPQGAFYLFPDFSYYLGKKFQQTKIGNTIDLADFLLEQAHVAVTAGEHFGAPGYLRLSYAADVKTVKEGMERIKKALEKLC